MSTARKAVARKVVVKKAPKSFNQMTKAEQKVAICQDVIGNILAKQINVVADNGYVVGMESKLSSAEEIKQMMPLIKKKCELCAKGAMMICKIDKFNNCNFLDLEDVDDYDTQRALDCFTKTELELIESAFERSGFVNSSFRTYDSFGYARWETNHELKALENKAIEFGQDFENDSDRLMAIMQNIVDHNGDFKPEVRYEIVKR